MITSTHHSTPSPAVAPSVFRGHSATLLRVVALIGLLLGLGTASGPQHVRAGAAPDSFSARSSALVDATLRFGQDPYAVVVNDTVTLDLVVDDAVNLAAWEVKLNFDPARLEVIQITPGEFLSGTGRTAVGLQLAPGAGQLSIGGYTYGTQPPVTGSGVLAQLMVRALATGPAPVILYDAILVGMNGSEVQSLPVSVSSTVVSVSAPLAVTLASFQATAQRAGIQVAWESASELDNQGFNLYRALEPAAPEDLLAFIPSQAPGSSHGFAYAWLDSDVAPGQTVYYWLEDVDLAGVAALHGPVSATFQAPTGVKVAGVWATVDGPAPVGGWILAGALVLVAGAGLVVGRRRAM
ncbi:MAG TPA: cohesin domain-containing protein [Anaerolineae bacterium]|nr:cohesin domain-containing protein [Anaerolineae bacterium]